MNLIFKKETSFPKNVIFWDILVAFLKHMPYLLKSYIKFCTHTKYSFSGSLYICSSGTKRIDFFVFVESDTGAL